MGNQTDYTYDNATGLVLTVTKPAGQNGVRPITANSYSQIWTYAKDGNGTLQHVGSIWEPVATAVCRTTAGTVTVSGMTTTLTCAGGASDLTITTISYAGSNNALPTSVTTASGDSSLSATTSTTYDNVGNVLTTTDPTGAVTRYRYDAARQLVGVVGPNPNYGGEKYRAVRNSYTSDGLPSLIEKGTVPSQSDSDWGSFSALASEAIGYDGVDRKVTNSVISGGSTQSLTQYTYDNANNLTCTAVRMNAAAFGSLPSSACSLGTQGPDGPDRITYATYDADNRLLKATEGYGVSGEQRDERTLTYSANGRVVTLADGKGNLTTDVYDGFDRLYQVEYPTPSNGAVSSTTDYEQYGYDADSRMIQDRRRDGNAINYTYDALGDKTQIAASTGSPATINNSFDNLGHVTLASAGDQALSYSYDALGRQTGESGAYGPFNYAYDLIGRLTKLTWPDGFYVNYDHDGLGEVTAIRENGLTSGVGVLASYSYNDLGQRTSVTRGNGVTTAYGYDSAWRLASLAHGFPNAANNQTFTFNYNAAGQINSRASANGAYAWTGGYAATRNYSLNGQNQVTQTTSSGTTTYGYDGRGNLNSDGVNSYGYDLFNNLVSINSSTTTMRSDPAGRLMAVIDWSGGAATAASRWFRYAGSSLLAEYGMVGSDNNVLHQRYVPGPGVDETVVWYNIGDPNPRRWLTTDERGSVIAAADASGNVVGVNTYDEYGVPQMSPPNIGRFQYTGQAWIAEVGLYHYKARDYSPTLGRFLQTDPIGYGDGPNWYNYVHGDPVNTIDPTGKNPPTSGTGGLDSPPIDVPCVQSPGRCGMGYPRVDFQPPNYYPEVRPVNIPVITYIKTPQNERPPTACPAGALANFARGAREFGSNMQGAGDWTAVAGLGVVGLGAVSVQPEIVASGGVGILVGKGVSTIGLGVQLLAGAYLYSAGDPKPLTSTAVGQSLSGALPPGQPGNDPAGNIGDAAASLAYPHGPDC